MSPEERGEHGGSTVVLVKTSNYSTRLTNSLGLDEALTFMDRTGSGSVLQALINNVILPLYLLLFAEIFFYIKII